MSNTSPPDRLSRTQLSEHSRPTNRFVSASVPIGLTLTVLLTPLWFMPVPESLTLSKQIFLVAIMAFTMVAWLMNQFSSASVEVRWGVVHTAAAAFVVMLGVSAALSSYVYGSIVGSSDINVSLLTLTALALLFFLVAERPVTEQRYWLQLAATATVVLTILALLQFAGIYIWPWAFTRVQDFNTVGSANDLAIYLALALPLMLTLLASAAAWLERTPLLIGGLLILVTLQFIGSELAWGMVLLGAVIWVVAEATVRRSLHIPFLAVPFILAIVSLLFILQPPLAALNLPVEVGLSQRLSVNVAVGTMTTSAKNVLVGSGPSTFIEDFSRFRPASLNQAVFVNGLTSIPLWAVRFSQAASWWLTLLVSLGLGGVAGLLMVILGSFWQGVRAVRGGLINSDLAAGLLASLVTIFVASFFTHFGLATLYLLWLTMGLLAMADIESQHVVSFEHLSFKAAIVIVVMVTSGLGVLLGFSVEARRFVAEVYVKQGTEALQRSDQRAALVAFGRAAAVAPQDASYHRLLAQVLLRRVMDLSQDKSANPDELRQVLVRAIQEGLQARAINSHNVENVQTAAQVYQQVAPFFDNAANLSVEAYADAQKLEPSNPVLPTEQARSYIVAADLASRNVPHPQDKNASEGAYAKFQKESLEQAAAALTTALMLKPDYAPARFLQAILAVRQGQGEEALAELNTLQQENPQDVSLYYQRGLLYYQQKQFTAAEQAFRNAVTLQPDFANAHYFLGLTLDQFGKRSEAISEFEALVKLDPKSTEARNILENLKAGRSALEQIVPPAQPPETRTNEPINPAPTPGATP